MATVLLLTALVEELQPVRDWIEPDHGWTEETDSLNYPIFRGSFRTPGQDSTINVVLASAGEMGPLVTATRATDLISQFRPVCVAMSGICAADAKKGARMGDIVVADRVWSQGVSKVTQDGAKASFDTLSIRPNHWLQKLELYCERFVQQEQALIERYRREALDCLERDLAECGWDKDRFQEVYHYLPGQSEFRPRFGSIVAVRDVTELEEPFAELQQTRRQTISLELESFAIAHAANYKTVPAFLFAKGVQDHARPPKIDTFRRFGSFASALFILRFLQTYIHELRRPAPQSVGDLSGGDDAVLVTSPPSPILALAERELDESCVRSAKLLTLATKDASERLADAALLAPGRLNCDTALSAITPAAWRGEIDDSWIGSLAALNRPLRINCSCILPAANIILELLRSEYEVSLDVTSSDLNGVEQMASANDSADCDFLIIANAPFFFHQPATAPDPFEFVMPLFRRSQALLQRRSSRFTTPKSVYVFPESSAAEQVRATKIQRFADIHDIDASSILPFIEQLNRDEAVVVWEPFASWLGREREYILNAETRYNIWVSLFARQHAVNERDGILFTAFINLFVATWNLVSMERTRILDPALSSPFALQFYAATGRRLWQRLH